MKQILIIHGGSSFDSRKHYLDDLKNSPLDYERLKPKQRWSTWIAEQMPGADVLLPSFPNAQNAVYDEWKVYFEKIVPFLTGNVALIGHSLGAMFLARYLHEHVLPKRAEQLILISPGYDDDSLEDLGSFRIKSATGIEKSAGQIHLFHSQDDPVVPYTEQAKFRHDLPDAQVHTFNDRGHFLDSKFPELLEILQAD